MPAGHQYWYATLAETDHGTDAGECVAGEVVNGGAMVREDVPMIIVNKIVGESR